MLFLFIQVRATRERMALTFGVNLILRIGVFFFASVLPNLTFAIGREWFFFSSISGN